MQMINVLSMAALASAAAIDRRTVDTTEVSFFETYPTVGAPVYSANIHSGSCLSETTTGRSTGAVNVNGTNTCVTFFDNSDCSNAIAGATSYQILLQALSSSYYSVPFPPACTKIETNVGSACPGPTTSEPETCVKAA